MSSGAPSEVSKPLTPLGHPDLVRFLGARVTSILALQIVLVAVGWYLYQLTGSALDLGLVGLAQFAATLLVTIPAGTLIDRFERRWIVIACQLSAAVMIALLTFGMASASLGRAGLLLLVALLGIARAVEHPAMASLLANLLAREQVAQGTAWSVTANQTAQIVGPALGGVLIWLAPWLAGIVAAALLVVAALFVGAIRATPVARTAEPVTVASLLSGFSFVLRERLLLATLSLDLFVVLLGGVTALLPIFARDILDVGPGGLGLLRAAPAVGALGMSIWLARRPLSGNAGRTLYWAIVIFGVATVVFALSRSMIVSLAALAVLGAADVISVVIRFALVQLNTPDELRGRVSAVNALFIGASNQLGDFESGAVAALIGAVGAALVGGIGSVLVAVIWWQLFPELASIRTLDGRR